MRVLLIEENTSTSKTTGACLLAEGYVCDVTDSGEDGIEIARHYDYDIIVLDLMLPDLDGFQVLRQLRSNEINTPVLVTSCLNEPEDKVKSLSLGADDFLAKPYDRRELIARIQAIVRRAKGYAEPVLRIGRLSVDLGAHCVEVDGKTIPLTNKEYCVLEMLSLRKGATLSKETFLNHLYGGVDEPDSKIIDVFICKLRKKLAEVAGGENYIETVWGRGYVLRDPTAEQAPNHHAATA
jgi:two-component system cell cycle response regulator CtrA